MYATGGVLFAAPFDVTRAELQGPAVPVLSGVRRANPGVGKAHYAVSSTGTIVYLPSPAAANASSDLALIDRNGTVTPLNLPLGAYAYPRVSPDGRRLAFTVATAQDEFIAVLELSGGKAMRRLTLEGHNRLPVWASDERRVVYQSDRDGDQAIFWQLADGSGAAERLTKPGPGESHAPESWSPATNTLLFSVQKEGEHTLWTLSLPETRVTPVGGVRSTIPINAVFSPDGRWIAYQSDQSGRATIYVQLVPPTGAVYQFLPRGADVPHEPMWSPTGKELFYNPRAGGFEVVAVTSRRHGIDWDGGPRDRELQLFVPVEHHVEALRVGSAKNGHCRRTEGASSCVSHPLVLATALGPRLMVPALSSRSARRTAPALPRCRRG